MLTTLLVACPPVIYQEEHSSLPALPQVGDSPDALVVQLESESPEERQHASDVLVSLGPDAVPALVDALGHEREWIRVRAALVLTRIGPDAIEATDALLVALEDRQPQVRRQAARALGAVAAPADRVASALALALADSNLDVVEAARRSLVGLGAAAASDLVEGVQSDDVVTRFGSVSALGELGSGATPVVAALVEALGDDEARVRSRAAWALGRILPTTSGRIDKDVMLGLKRALRDKESSVQYSTVTALGEIGPRAKRAVPALEALLLKLDLPATDLAQLAEQDPAAAEAAWTTNWLATAVRNALQKIDP